MILYNCKPSLTSEGQYVVTKFNDDMNIESSYLTSLAECECPAGVRPTCRHRQMLPYFIAADHIGDDHYFCYDDQTWHVPFAEDGFADEVEVTEEELAAPPTEMVDDLAKAQAIIGKGGLTILEQGSISPAQWGHQLYMTGDVDVPEQIKDRNGEVVLSMCRLCGEAEAGLDQPCTRELTQSDIAEGATASVASPVAPAGEVERSVVPSPAPFRRRV